MKRGRGDQLTGGSGDVNPQELVFSLTQTGGDATTVGNIQLPIPRLPTVKGKNLVVELLWAQFFLSTPSLPAAGAIAGRAASVTTRPNPPTTFNDIFSDPRALALYYQTFAAAAGSTPFGDQKAFHEEDLTDGAGHGILVATDVLYFAILTAATGQANNIVFRLGYRFKQVSLEEYIGIVQSQQ